MIQIISPKNHSCLSSLSEVQCEFINNTYMRMNATAHSFDYLNLVAESEDRTQPVPVTVQWDSEENNNEYRLLLSDKTDLSDPQIISTSESYVHVYNLLPGRTYYFQIQSATENSIISSFNLEATNPRCMHIPGLVNVRDVGGWTTKVGKKIRQGLLYRGCKMERTKSGNPPIITDDGKRIMVEELKIKTDIDLRADSLEKLDQSELHEYGVQYKILPCRSYEEFFMDDCAEGNRKIMETLADENTYPAYIHCWGGADRTSMVIFMLGCILGMNEEDMLLDYEFTSLAIWGVRTRSGDYFDNFKKALAEYGDGHWCENVIRYMYSIGVTDAVMDKIRKIFLSE